MSQCVDDLEEVFQAAFLDNSMADDQFSKYLIYSNVGILETTKKTKKTLNQTLVDVFH